MSKTCIVSFANSDSVRYTKNLKRLIEKCKSVCPEIDLLTYTSFESVGSPHHTEVNYGFKIKCIQKALSLGYTKIIWVDSAVFPIAPIGNFLAELEKRGILFFENIGLPLGYWVSDACLQNYGIERFDAFSLPQVMGCLFALDFEKGVTIDFWSRYEKDALNPLLSNGAWKNESLQVSKNALVSGHRHDQSIASCILNVMGVEMVKPNDTFLAYVEWYKRKDLTISDSVCFNSQSY